MDGFSPDGYIIDQDCLSQIEYRTMPASINGCGWVAAYNLRRYLGHEVRFEDVLSEMDRMHTLRIPGPTTMPVMRGLPQEIHPRNDRARSDATRPWRRREGAGRVSCATVRRTCRTSSSFSARARVFRFLNVNDGLEDFVCSMEMFFATHVLPPHYVSIFTI